MRLGLLTDVHERVDRLRRAIDRLRSEGADRLLMLGDCLDAFGDSGRARETVDLLAAAGATGVWGNHDFGYCHDVPEHVRATCDPAILAYMATLEPCTRHGECLFAHMAPHLDPFDPAHLWGPSDAPETPDSAQRCFDAVSDRFIFIGHHHRWLAIEPGARLDWNGESPLDLDAHDRLLVVIAPVCDGSCALLDTAERTLRPLRI